MMTALLIILLLSLAVLLCIWIFSVVHLSGAKRKYLFPAGVAVFFIAFILFGGELLMNSAGVTWRQWVRLTLSWLLWLAGLTAGCLTVRYAVYTSKDENTGWWVRGIAGLSLVFAMLCGSVLGGLWAIGPSEEVGTWNSHKVVQESHTFLDSYYEIYEYRGPFIRGDECLKWGEEGLLDH